MKKIIIIFLAIITFCKTASAQYYPNIASYNISGTPANGIKINTNLPFTTSSQMPTIIIQGYSYGRVQTIGLMLNYYVYTSPSDGITRFIEHSMSSFGGYTPQVMLANESGKVVIFINDKVYCQRFMVSAFAKGLSADAASNYLGWTVTDDVLSSAATATVTVPYINSFAGTVNMPSGIWNSSGKVGIGTLNPDAALTVNGTVHSKEVKVDMNLLPDYVFDKTYDLTPLNKIKEYIDKNHHLPEVPSAEQVSKDGLKLGEMNALLLKKVEELTLYLINNAKQDKEKDAKLQSLQKQIEDQNKAIQSLQQQMDQLIKKPNN